jgi:cytochrome P450
MSSQPIETPASLTPDDYKPLDPLVRANPYPYYEVLRREAPVHRILPGVPFFAVTRHEHVSEVIHAPETYSSTALQILGQGGAVSMGPNSGALAGHRLLASPMMIAVDPPEHGRLRRLVNRGFTPRRIAALEPRLREIATQYLGPDVASGRLELMRDFAIPFPVTVIAELLGVEPERHEQFKRWSDAFVLGLSSTTSEFTREDVQRLASEMAEYVDRIAAERRTEPRDDLVSVLVQAEEGEALSASQILSFVVLLLIAGNETTTNLIGNGVKALLQHPETLARVNRDRALIPALIEETLRFDSPVQGIPRKVARDVKLGGVELPKDAFLMVMYGSANRDERVFPDPDRFDIDRKGREHIAFGHGIHFCLGAALARLEARVAFETLFERCQRLQLESAEIPMMDSMLLRGPKRLSLAFEPA